MDMHTDRVNNDIPNNNNDIQIPNGYKKVDKDEFIQALSKDNEEEQKALINALSTLLDKIKEKNDKRYPVITTGRVENIKEDGKIIVKMIDDDSEATESVGYTNQTPFTVNEQDYVKVCRQTASDGVNSWIIGVNTLNNKKDAFVFLEDSLQYIWQLQKQINVLSSNITSLLNLINSLSLKTDSEGNMFIEGDSAFTREIINRRIPYIDESIHKKVLELNNINKGKDNN